MSDIDAQGLIDLLQKHDLPVKGLTIKDVDDPTTWSFMPKLEPWQEQQAIALIQEALHPIVVPPARTAVHLREAILLFTPEEYVSMASAVSAELIRLRAAVMADTTFNPQESYVVAFFQACVDAKALTQKRADEMYLLLNPPV